uniref:hypothetical protein n=1 Tax=Agathobacter sp. TaxID=2021311 RepID=UPI004056D08B
MASSKEYLDFISEQLSELDELPYDGAKEMLLVDDVDSKEFLTRLFDAMYNDLPAPKKKK